MADDFRGYFFVSQYNLSTKLILGCLQIQLGLICSVGIWTLSEAKLQAAQAHQTWKSPSELTEQVTKVNPESAERYSKLRTHRYVRAEALAVGFSKGKLNFDDLELSMPLPSRLKRTPILMAAPENFNPDLRLPPALPEPPQNSNPAATSRKI